MLKESLIEGYLVQCECERRLDAKTMRAYRCDLEQYRTWAVGRRDPFSKESVRAYLAHLNGRYAPSSVKRKIASVRAFMIWAAEEGKVAENPFAGLRLRVREPKCLPRTIALSDLELLFHYVYGDWGEPVGFALARDRAVLEALIATGVRVSELCALDVCSVDLAGRSARIAGKGGKERTVQIEDPHTISALEDYLVLRGEVAATGEEALFVNRLGTRISDRAVREMVARRARDAGLSAHVTPHMFRHTFATLLLEGDVDIRYIQRLLGHGSISTTEIYAHVTSSKLREIMRESNPRKAIRE